MDEQSGLYACLVTESHQPFEQTFYVKCYSLVTNLNLNTLNSQCSIVKRSCIQYKAYFCLPKLFELSPVTLIYLIQALYAFLFTGIPLNRSI